MKKTIIALLAAACEKVIDIDPSQSERKVVVGAAIEAGDSIEVDLSYSRFFLDDRPCPAIDNATVRLTVDGTGTLAATSGANGRYRLGGTAQAGQTLRLDVSVPGHESVSAITRVPQAVLPTAARASAGSEPTSRTIRFRLPDNASEENYYSLRIHYEVDTVFLPRQDLQGRISYDTLARGTHEGYATIKCNDYQIAGGDAGLDAIASNDEGVQTLYFTDHNINGRNCELTLSAYGIGTAHFTLGEDGEPIYAYTSRPRLTLELASLCRDRYLYEVSSAAYAANILLNMLGEPVQIHTNIEGGIGIFAARTQTQTPIYVAE